MKKKLEFLALLSSDKRPRYLEDIYACMAMPASASYRFRYDASYLPPDVLEIIGDEYNDSFDAIVCFRGNFTQNAEAIVPVRWVKVKKIKRVLDFFVFYFDFAEYPKFSPQFKNQSGTSLNACAREYLSQIPQGLRQFPVLSARIGFLSPETDRKSDTWLTIVRTLSMHKSFEGLHFVRIADLSGNMNLTHRDGQAIFSTPSGSYPRIDLEYYSERFSENETLELSADESVVRFANGRSHRLSSRYDLLTLLLEAKQVDDDAETQFQFSISRADNPNSFEFALPIRITRPKHRFFWRMVAPTVGALLLASRSFLGPSTSPALIGVLIVVGALLIGAGVARRR